MESEAVLQLCEQLQAANVVASVDEYAVINISMPPIKAFIMKRPYYCDRGCWLVNAASTDSRMLVIDAADMFPRYYFFDECLVKEFSHWIHLRLAQVGVEQNIIQFNQPI